MRIPMLTILGLVFVLVSAGTPAQERQNDAEQFHVDWNRYLSDTDRLDISRRMAEADIEERIRNGTLYNGNEGPIQISIPVRLVPDRLAAAPPAEQFHVDWNRYLSDTDRLDISRRMAEADIEERIRSGTLYNGDEGPIQISIPVRLVPDRSAAAPPAATGAAAAVVLAGTIECDINTQTPHPGSGPNSTTVPKAKSSGTCRYTHLGPGAEPPTLTYRLDQILIAMNPGSAWGIGRFWMATHARYELNSSWNDGTAQVFGDCSLAGTNNYVHSDVMWVLPPSGWSFIGPNPYSVGTPRTNGITC